MHPIKKWRESNHVAAQDLAYFLKISSASLSHIELGATRISGDTAIKVSQLIGIGIYELRPDLQMTDEHINEFHNYRTTRKAVRQAPLKKRKNQRR